MNLACSTVATRALCKEACVSVLSCGHPCKKKCFEPCNSADCNEFVTTAHVNICGHSVTISCKNNQQGEFNYNLNTVHLNKVTFSFTVLTGGILKESDMTSHLKNCSEPCGAVLECTHLCKRTCGECFNGRVHRACSEHCGRSLVCGHT